VVRRSFRWWRVTGSREWRRATGAGVTDYVVNDAQIAKYAPGCAWKTEKGVRYEFGGCVGVVDRGERSGGQ
jgi:hypothetical protein